MSRLFQSVPFTLVVWAVFCTAIVFFVELFPVPMIVRSVIYNIFIAAYVFYDTILHQRFTPANNFFLAIIAVNVVTLLARVIYRQIVWLEPDFHFMNLIIGYGSLSLIIPPILYFLLYQFVGKK